MKNIDTGEYLKFYNLTEKKEERERFLRVIDEIRRSGGTLIGHHILGFDWPVLHSLLEMDHPDCLDYVVDTLVISKLVDYPRSGHSIEDYGLEFGLEKGKFSEWGRFSQEMEDYCIRDVDICHRVYVKYLRYISNPDHARAIDLEQRFQIVCNTLNTNGFAFNKEKADKLLARVEADLKVLDEQILSAFPPREVLIREFTPKATKYGTISKTSVPRTLWDSISDYEIGKSYRHTRQEEFNPSSHKQIIRVLNEAGWKPTDKTKTHIDCERELRRTKNKLDKIELESKLSLLQKTGWKVNEANIATLPKSAPEPARLLAKRIMLESRRRTLTEWTELVQPDGRIHGKFYAIGAWTHRMAHQAPNTANIPKEFDTNGNIKVLGKELRQCWRAPKNRLLVGVDADSIQLRIFAHLTNDKNLIEAIVNGKKADKTDSHSYNQRVLGKVCKTRDAAKRFLYALFLGAGLDKLASILECTREEVEEALDRFLERYPGFVYLKEKIIPADAKRGWFVGLNGAKVRIPGDEVGLRQHLAMSGYLQHGEQCVVKETVIRTLDRIEKEKLDGLLVNIVHDEVVIETKNDVVYAEYISDIFCQEIIKVGIDYKLNCPLAGDGHVGINWYEIH